MNLLSEIHFWTLKDNVCIKHNNIGVYKYFSKKDHCDNVLYNGKRLYCNQRGGTWYPENKRPVNLKEKLKELEDHLLQDKVVCSSFEDCKLQLLLSRGLFISITINPHTSDITNLIFNKLFSSKIHTDVICSGVIDGEQVCYLCTDGRVHCWGGIWKDEWIIDAGFRRKLSTNKELVCIWGSVSSEKLQPWTPLGKDHQKANLILYWVGSKGPELLAHKKTEGEPIQIVISRIESKVLLSIEQKVSVKGAVTVDVNVLELSANTLKRVSIISVPLQTQVSCCNVSDNENHVLLGCIDGSLVLLDRYRGSTQVIKTSIIPILAVWHNSGTVLTISNEKGQLQYYDLALNRINTQITGEDSTPLILLDLAGYFILHPRISHIKWGSKHLAVVMENGPLVIISHTDKVFNFISHIQHYLQNEKVEQAIGLLIAWEWGDQCLSALQKIVAFLLKRPLTKDNAQHLQKALSCFHSPAVALSVDIRHKYGMQVQALTRRFFHQLVRYKMFETAFLLAVDIGHHDLFMDLYYCATELGEREMAAAARAQASSLLSRCSSEASCCSRSSCSQCSSSESGDCQSVSPVGKSASQQFPSATSDNYLTTNFNNIDPTTYSTASSNYSVDLPKIPLPPKPPLNRIVKAPINPPPLPIAPPPLPFAPLLHKNTFAPRNSNTGPTVNFSLPVIPNRSYFTPDLQVDYRTYQPSHVPLQTIPESIPFNTIVATSTTVNKKPPAKVKFSDTVTAFIVPEIKRPVRPPPPPHITDPQKELADSLPLCHPNEDYLKDFTPICHDSDETPAQTNIKVVHFGVV